MALVYGQSLCSAVPVTDLKGGAGANAGAGDDSDDEEYVYVSRLAEQIAAHAMLDEEDEAPDYRPQPPAIQLCSEDITFSRFSQDVKSHKKIDKYAHYSEYPVSPFAAVWRDHGPSEWECFYTPSPQAEVSKQASLLSSRLHQAQKLRTWTSLCIENAKQAGSQTHGSWDLLSHCKTQPCLHDSPLIKRKESLGTGVFLPKIVSTGSHFRRKAGNLSTKPAYAPRGKLL
ncbi:hypothetical protein L7F22_041780 [Adiantum nelumboides]|nr:hypothetical protein [Adiantum nelumboides]